MTKKNSKIIILSLCIMSLLATTGCYRMPTENDYSLIPSTNNKDFTREGSGGGNQKMPSIGY